MKNRTTSLQLVRKSANVSGCTQGKSQRKRAAQGVESSLTAMKNRTTFLEVGKQGAHEESKNRQFGVELVDRKT